MKIKLIAIALLLIIACGNLRAELPFESNNSKAVVVTVGINDSPFNNDKQHIMSLNYLYENKIMFGVSLRDEDNYTYYDAISKAAIINSGGTIPDLFERRTYINVYSQIKPLKFLNQKFPISFSLFVGVQDITKKKNLIANAYFYKKLNLSTKHSIQPFVAVGYRNISIVSNGGYRNFDAGLIYSYQLDKLNRILVTPMMNRYWGANTYTIQVGFMHGFKL